MESARQVVLREWNRRQTVQYDTTGGWHNCHRTTCPIVNLREYVCIEGQHIVPQSSCPAHSGAVLHVTDVYVCRTVGCAHICDQTTCRSEGGKCSISGRSCVAAVRSSLSLPVSNKRCRRRSSSVHTNEQSACILIYNLLFSNRRVAGEVQRATSALEVARRRAQRVVKSALRERAPLRYQALVDIYTATRQRMRYSRYLFICDDADVRREICTYYARIAVRIWHAVIHLLPLRSMFECTCAAILYAMRKGVAWDGLYAIPPDRFLAYALPDAHAIKDVDISRRSLTQAKNALYTSIQRCVQSGEVPVEQFALKFKDDSVPNVIAAHFQNVGRGLLECE